MSKRKSIYEWLKEKVIDGVRELKKRMIYWMSGLELYKVKQVEILKR